MSTEEDPKIGSSLKRNCKDSEERRPRATPNCLPLVCLPRKNQGEERKCPAGQMTGEREDRRLALDTFHQLVTTP